jgi:hypothetical protein
MPMRDGHHTDGRREMIARWKPTNSSTGQNDRATMQRANSTTSL